MNPKIIKCFFVLLVTICIIATLGIWSPNTLLDMIDILPTTDNEYYDAFFAPRPQQQQQSSSSSSLLLSKDKNTSTILLRQNRNKKPLSSSSSSNVVGGVNSSTRKKPAEGDQVPIIIPMPTTTTTTTKEVKTTIAYAVSITKFKDKIMYDNAAVLHKSIKLAHHNNINNSSKYDYHMVAFVHPDAANECQQGMEQLGYEVQIRDTPLNESLIRNNALQEAQSVGCCGIKEYLKLYSYTLTKYPIVVHLDLDTIVLKPMDELFDLMLFQQQQQQSNLDADENKIKESLNNLRSKVPAMWIKDPNDYPPRIDFAFTRDYNMVDPPRRKPHQIGVQGGFLVIRPNITDFERMVEIILDGGNYIRAVGWGGRELQYGGYYGEATIQGLASYYYGEFEPYNRSLELNRCNYNTMVDDPMNTAIVKQRPKDVTLQCRTLEKECEDCRKTNLNEIYTAHFTVCGKPQWCRYIDVKDDLCMKLFHQWHTIRRLIEKEWETKYSSSRNYDPKLADASSSSDPILVGLQGNTLGHCSKLGRSYIPMEYPYPNVSSEILLD